MRLSVTQIELINYRERMSLAFPLFSRGNISGIYLSNYFFALTLICLPIFVSKRCCGGDASEILSL